MQHSFRHTILSAVAAGMLCSAFTPGDDPTAFRTSTVRSVMNRIASEHYQPPQFDDRFSGTVWKKFLESQDQNKLLLLQSDIATLRQWEHRIDDELRNPAVSFFNVADSLIALRTKETIPIFQKLMKKPLDLSRNDSMPAVNGEWPADRKAQTKAWERYLKLQVLRKIVELRAADSTLTLRAAEKLAQQKVLSWLNTAYNNRLSATDQRFSSYLNTVVMEIDPHTLFFAPADKKDYAARMSQRYFGVGLELIAEDGQVRVKRVFPGGAASRSGLVRENDQVLAVSDNDGKMQRVSGLSVLDVSRLIRGDSGTVLKMHITRTGKEQEISLVRAEIKDNSNVTKSAYIDKNGKKTGYIRLPEFYRDFSRPDGPQCALDIARAIVEMKKENIAGLIIDLRGNGGGSLEEVQKMVGLMLPQGPVTLGRFKDKVTTFDMRGWSDVYYDGPLTVLVDENSASASEMFSGAIQDYGRGVIMGSTSTFGKGTMQESRQMGKAGSKALGTPNVSYGMLNITLGRFYRITGAATQLNGVQPDVVIPGKGDWKSLRERDYTSAWTPDSIEAAYFIRSKHAAALPAAIAAAKSRVQQDTGFTALRQSAAWLKAHEKDAKSLQLSTFLEDAAARKQHESRLEGANRLTVAMSARTIAPLPDDPLEAARLKEWIESVRTDRTVSHAVDLVQDLAR
ncbi:carboxy terminal-processing peptidase [Chitinophaga lutea]